MTNKTKVEPWMFNELMRYKCAKCGSENNIASLGDLLTEGNVSDCGCQTPNNKLTWKQN